MRLLRVLAAAVLLTSPAKAIVFAEDRFIATVDPASSSVKYGDRYTHGWDWVWGDRHPKAGNYQTASVSGQFGVTARYSYDRAPVWQRYTMYQTDLIFSNLELVLDNAAIGGSFQIPEMTTNVETFLGLNPDFDPFYNRFISGRGLMMTMLGIDLFPPILENIESIRLDGDVIALTGNTGGGYFDEVFVFDLKASLAWVGTGEAADFHRMDWDDGHSFYNTSGTTVAPSAVPVPAGLLLLAPVIAIGAVAAARRGRAEQAG